jgi:hypothetical protein
LRRILPENQNIQGEERLILLQIGLFCSIVETHISLERKPSVLEFAAPISLLPCEILLSV